MSLLGGSKAKTHKSLPMDKLMRMAGDVEDIARDGTVRAEDIDDLSADCGVPREKLYAGLGMSGDVTLQLEHDIQFVICTGGCQDFGALPCVRELLDIREERLEDGSPGFDVVPRSCLNRCQSAPVVEVRSKEGNAVIQDATPSSLGDAVDDVFAG